VIARLQPLTLGGFHKRHHQPVTRALHKAFGHLEDHFEKVGVLEVKEFDLETIGRRHQKESGGKKEIVLFDTRR